MTCLLVAVFVVGRICGNTKLGRRNRLPGSLVGRLLTDVARISLDRQSSAIVSSIEMVFAYFTFYPLVRPAPSLSCAWQSHRRRNRWRIVWRQIQLHTILWRNVILRFLSLRLVGLCNSKGNYRPWLRILCAINDTNLIWCSRSSSSQVIAGSYGTLKNVGPGDGGVTELYIDIPQIYHIQYFC